MNEKNESYNMTEKGFLHIEESNTFYKFFIIDDIFDSGLTLYRLVNLMKDRGAKSVKSCVFLEKQIEHAVDYRPDYIGYEIPDAFVIGYGLDYAEKYRQLPYIGIIKPEAVK
mgnify:CR=1 FL=1